MICYYEIAGWEDGSLVVEAEDQMTMERALYRAERIMGGHYGESVDRVEIREFDIDRGLYSKTIFTPCEGVWKKDYQYIGENKGETHVAV